MTGFYERLQRLVNWLLLEKQFIRKTCIYFNLRWCQVNTHRGIFLLVSLIYDGTPFCFEFTPFRISRYKDLTTGCMKVNTNAKKWFVLTIKQLCVVVTFIYLSKCLEGCFDMHNKLNSWLVSLLHSINDYSS